VGEQVTFYANYSVANSSALYPQGLGWDIGQVVWNTSDIGTVYSIAFADLDNDGEKDEVIVGDSTRLYGYYANGTRIGDDTWWDEITAAVNEMQIGDFDNDSYYNDIAIASSDGYVRIFNETGDEVWSSNDLGWSANSIALGDAGNDGMKNDIAVGWEIGASTIGLWNSTDGSTWTHRWNHTAGPTTTSMYEVAFCDCDRDGNEDDIVGIASTSTFVKVHAFNETGGSLWNTTDLGGRGYSIAVVDLDHDGYRDEVVVGEQGDLFVFEFNGSYNTEYTASDAIWTTTDPIFAITEISVADLDNDGYEDDLVIGDIGTNTLGPGYIFGFDNSSNQLWNFSIPTDTVSEDFIYSISVGDINNDGEKEIIASSENEDVIWILNRTGSLLWSYKIGLGNIGSSYGSSSGIDISDINNDGINDIAVASANGYAHILQDVTCTIKVNNGTSWNSANMTWNSTLHKWVI